MKKRHLVKSELEHLEESCRKHKPHLAAIMHQIGHLVDPEANLNEHQFTEVLHLLDVASEHRTSVIKIVPEMVTMINSSYTVHLLASRDISRDK